MTIRKLIYMILSWLAILSLAGALFMLVMLNLISQRPRCQLQRHCTRRTQPYCKIHMLGEPVDDIVATLKKP